MFPASSPGRGATRRPMRHSLRSGAMVLALAARRRIPAHAQTAATAPEARQQPPGLDRLRGDRQSRPHLLRRERARASQSGNYSRRDTPAVLVARLPGNTPSEQVSVQPGYAYRRAARSRSRSTAASSSCSPRRARLDASKRRRPGADRGDEGRLDHDRQRHLDPRYLFARHLLAHRLHGRLRRHARRLSA